MKIKYYFNFIPKLFLYVIYKFSEHIHRDRSKWVFGSHFGFADNSKYLFIEINQNYPEITPIWISHTRKEVARIRQLGFKCYYWISFQGLYHSFTAGVYICTKNTIDINRFASGGTLYVNLNHGVGVKRCYWLRPKLYSEMYGVAINEMNHSFVFKVLTFPWLFRVPDLCLVTSHFQAEKFFLPMFRISRLNLIFANYPRNEILFWEKKRIKEFASKYEPPETLSLITKCESFNKVYIYMPTWRNDGVDFITSSLIDFAKLNDILRDKGELLILKLHPYTKLDLTEIIGYSNICLFNPQCDIYNVMPFTDCLITDYSSIYSDYILMNKEIILYVFDLESYLSKCTELEEYDKYYLGKRAYCFSQLLYLIEQAVDCHVNKEEQNRIMGIFWDSINNRLNLVETIKKKSYDI